MNHNKTIAGRLYYVTLTVQGWVDVFTRKEYVYELIENLKFCQEHKGLELYAYVIMPNHLHLICKTENTELRSILRDFKSYTAKKIMAMINNNPQESRSEWMMYSFAGLQQKKPKTRTGCTISGKAEITLLNSELMK